MEFCVAADGLINELEKFPNIMGTKYGQEANQCSSVNIERNRENVSMMEKRHFD